MPVVTIDDDCLYEPNLLQSLWDSYQKYPNCVNARRCHRIVVTKDNFLDSYSKWEKKVTDILEPSHMLFATGVGGVLYPPDILKISDECLDDIMKSITADDIYLKKREDELDIKVKWVEGNPNSYEDHPLFKQGTALQMSNTNDDVVKSLNFKPKHNLYSRNPLHVILRCCDKVECVNFGQCKNRKREFGNGKVDVIQTCVTTLIDSIKFAKDNGWDIRFTLVNDSLQESTLNFIKDVCSRRNIGCDVINSKPGNINSFKCCFEHALKQKDNEFILFVEDDYLCDKNAINEIMLFFNMFGDKGREIWLNPTTDIGDNHIDTRNKDGTWYNGVTLPSSKNGIGIWWRQFNHSTSTFATSVEQLKKHKDTFDYMFTLSKLQQYERNKIYEQEMLFQPLYPLMQHYQKSSTMYWFDNRNQERERPFEDKCFLHMSNETTEYNIKPKKNLLLEPSSH